MQFSIFLLVPYISNGNKIINIMKCSQKKYTDNLYYEYYVGKYFINKYIKIFPNFLETYNCFMLKNKDMLLENISKLSYKLSDNLELFDNSSINKWRDSCVNSDLICILIEYVNNPKKLLSIFKSYVNESKTVPNARNKMNDICVLSSILYQTYFVLSNLGNKYTHYDFHIENILLDVPYEKREYMLLNYNLLDGKKIVFPTKYIAKIIDYGKNYFKLDDKINSNQIRDIIFNSCENNGLKSGYYQLINGFDEYFIKPDKSNISHDLRLLSSFSNIYNKQIPYETEYGTSEKQSTTDASINNIYDAIKMLENYVSQNINTLKDIFKNHNLVAILNIYQDERNYELIEGEKILDVISEYYNYINISKFISNLNLNEIGYFKCRFLFKKIKRYI